MKGLKLLINLEGKIRKVLKYSLYAITFHVCRERNKIPKEYSRRRRRYQYK